jgi:hypothetical protein
MKQHLGTFRLAAALVALGMLTGCAGAHVGVGYRYYDPGHSDYHVWSDSESGYYNQWVIENHRQNKEFRKVRREDQQTYWQWRHDHPDHR